MDAIAVSYALALLGPLKGNKDGISENSEHKTILDLVDLLKAKQAELDQAYEDIETFVQAHQRECDIKVQIANELKEKDKRIEAVSLILEGLKKAKYMHSQNKAYNSILIEKLERALRGEHE